MRRKATDIVKIHNDINLFSLGSFTKVESDILMATILEIRNAEGNDLTISLSRLKKILNYKKSNANFLASVQKVASKLLHLRVWNTNNNEIEERNIFHKYKIDKKKNTLTIVVIPEERYLFCKLTEQFLQFNFSTYCQLPSSYARSLYRLCVQWKSRGRLVIGSEQFRFAMGIPNSYSTSNIDNLIIKPSIEALNGIFTNLSYRKIYGKREEGGGKRITAYEFTFDAVGKKPAKSEYEKHVDRAKELGIPEQSAHAFWFMGLTGEAKLQELAQDRADGIPF